MGTKADYWLHDLAVNYQARTEWKHTGIVVLDNAIPFSVGRKQTLPLYAKATERLIAQGAKGVFLDTQISNEVEGKMPYAICIEKDGQARWSEPLCHVNANQQCQLKNSEAGNAPLKMNETAITHFNIAPYLNGNPQFDFLLYGMEAMMAIPKVGLVANARLVTNASSIARWLDMSKDHAIYKLISRVAPDKVNKLYQPNNTLDEICHHAGKDKICRRVRLSKPLYQLSDKKRLILPLSRLASCNDKIGNQAAALLKDKVVILQVTAPNEPSDIIITPMVAAIFSPKLPTPGAQYLTDEIETVLNEDYPKQPPYLVKIILFICAAFLSVLLGAYFSQPLLWFGSIVIFLLITATCFFLPVTQLWPVSALMLAYFLGAIQIIAAHLVQGFKHNTLLHQYLPKQIIDILMPLKEDDFYRNKPCNVVTLMSDLAGYTTITGLLKEPEYVMDLMNDYLGKTSIVLQNKYNGILEAYVGDLVCYYWEYEEGGEALAYKNALVGAIELASLQKKFFSSVSLRYKENLAPEVIEKLTSIIDAGIGLAAGHAVKGNLGPKEGVKKYSLLGDPLNLAARVEGLTRHFNTEIIVAGDFSQILEAESLAVRRIGKITVKGRAEPETVYALGKQNDPRFSAENIKAWDLWIAAIESSLDTLPSCPAIYKQDKKTILSWQARKLLSNTGVWKLHEK